MGKKVLIISSGLRAGSISEILAREAEKGAVDAGHNVEFLRLKDKSVQFCRGCLACQKTQKCVISDDMSVMVDKVKNADVLIFATPIYYYEMSGLMKTFLDRCNPLFVSDYKFRDVYLITSSYDQADDACERAAHGLEGWIVCFEKSRLAGVLNGGGLGDEKEALSHQELLQKAYQLGKNI
jgi:multimeric flavodoxin WrbA